MAGWYERDPSAGDRASRAWAPPTRPGPEGAPVAFYAARPGGWRDWWNLLHAPYTAWHLSYVVIGAALAPHVDVSRLVATLLAFFLAVGIAAHALDELRGRPLRTRIPGPVLVAASAPPWPVPWPWASPGYPGSAGRWSPSWSLGRCW